MEKFDITIIGAGVIGLAVAAELGDEKKSIILLEKNKKFGQETSSRNSEVIHAGIYYPENTMKALLCTEGRKLLYEECKKYDIPYKNCGKLIIAVTEDEITSLETLKKNGEKNNVCDLHFLTEKEIKKMEPCINTVSALYSPSTGILDTHRFMYHLMTKGEAKGVMFSFDTPLTGLKRNKKGWICEILDADRKKFTFFSKTVINCAGLSSAEVASMAGIKDYRLYFCKGEYFSVGRGKKRFINGLVYPSPARKIVGLGIHTVVDLRGDLKLGPNAFYTDRPDYTVNTDHSTVFYESCRPFLPFLEKEDLIPDMSGIRPKLQGPGDPVADFIIKAEEGDYKGLINLIGIESPGLTSSLSIAKKVASIYSKLK